MLNWFQALGGVSGGVAAIATAVIAVLALRQQQSDTHRALEAQAEAARQAREHERQLANEQRLWDRRVDYYARLSNTMRQHFATSSEQMDAVASEADMLASDEIRDLVDRFVYDDPTVEQKIELFGEFQSAARRELGTDAALGRRRAAHQIPAQSDRPQTDK